LRLAAETRRLVFFSLDHAPPGSLALQLKKSAGHRPGDEARFIGAWFKNPLKTGAVAPSSKALARLMASYVDPHDSAPVIELGPGTGPVTAALLHRGVRPERLFLIEYSSDFVTLLRRRFPGVHVIQGDAYALKETVSAHMKAPIGAIVSSLPLLTRPEKERQGLLEALRELGKAKAPFIQFTYGGKAPVPPPVGFMVEKSRTILFNVPPARVFVYRQATNGSIGA
jgi:phosphatidylethanolamine/phosphatidyl-N-methylethanolamine N-methyltransferase